MTTFVPLDLSIIIVNWNGGTLLHDCLASIRASEARHRSKTIVVDNASSDGSREMAEREFPDFKVINSGDNLGFARGNNLARPHVDTPLVLFLNPDTVLLRDALTRMIEFMSAHPEVGALGCKMRYPDGQVQEQGLQRFPSPGREFLHMLFLSSDTHGRLKRFLPYLDPNRSAYVTKLYGGCLMVRTELLDRVGWFDERYFMYAEDVDLCQTILNAGFKIYYLADAEILHVAGGVTKRAASGFSILMKCESIAKLMEKYYGSFGRFRYVIALFAGSLARLGMLLGMRLISWFTPVGRQIDYAGSAAKYRRILRWCLGLEKPVIVKQRGTPQAA